MHSASPRFAHEVSRSGSSSDRSGLDRRAVRLEQWAARLNFRLRNHPEIHFVLDGHLSAEDTTLAFDFDPAAVIDQSVPVALDKGAGLDAASTTEILSPCRGFKARTGQQREVAAALELRGCMHAEPG